MDWGKAVIVMPITQLDILFRLRRVMLSLEHKGLTDYVSPLASRSCCHVRTIKMGNLREMTGRSRILRMWHPLFFFAYFFALIGCFRLTLVSLTGYLKKILLRLWCVGLIDGLEGSRREFER